MKDIQNMLSDCTITILTYQRSAQLSKSLGFLYEEFSKYNIKIIVIDNGSTKESRRALEGWSLRWSDLSYYSYSENLGCSKGRSEAWRRGATKYILSLDDDIYYM